MSQVCNCIFYSASRYWHHVNDETLSEVLVSLRLLQQVFWRVCLFSFGFTCSSNYHLGKNKVEHRTLILRTLPPPNPPPPPPLPKSRMKTVKAKTSHFPILDLEGGGVTNVPSISSTTVAPNLSPNPYRLFPNFPKPLFFKKRVFSLVKKASLLTLKWPIRC